MTLQEFYQAVGGDYQETLAGLGKEARIYKYLNKIAAEKCIEEITAALAAEKYEEAFRMAHNLKGASSTVGLNRLQAASSALTESLRHGPVGDVKGLLAATAEEYVKVTALIDQQNPQLQMGEEHYNLVRRLGDTSMVPESLGSKTIGALEGAQTEVIRRYLAEQGLQQEVIVYPNMKQRDAALRSGEVDTIIAEDSMGDFDGLEAYAQGGEQLNSILW